MILEPVATPVTKPAPLIVATEVVADVHGVEGEDVPVPVNWVVAPTQVVNVPETIGLETVTMAVFVQLLASVYVIVVVPDETEVTKPVLLTVATPGALEIQGFVPFAIPEPVN